MCQQAGLSLCPQPQRGHARSPQPWSAQGWGPAREAGWHRGRNARVGLGVLRCGEGGLRGDVAFCHAPNTGPGPSQTGSGARGEGSAARWSVRGCEQLDPANEASLSRTGLSPLCSLPCLHLPGRAPDSWGHGL